MKNRKAKSTALAALCALSLPAHAAVVFSDNFDGIPAGTNIPGWSEENLTGDNAGVEGGHFTTASQSVWFNTGAGGLREEAIFADTGTVNTSSSVLTLTYDLIGRTPYTGNFFAQIWAGTPGAGTLLGQHIGVNPPAGSSQTNQLVVNGSSDPGNIFIRFHATDFDGAASGQFQQARLDTVSLDASPIPEPTTGLLFAFGGMLAICRRRRRS